jgi:hypothetical protein
MTDWHKRVARARWHIDRNGGEGHGARRFRVAGVEAGVDGSAWWVTMCGALVGHGVAETPFRARRAARLIAQRAVSRRLVGNAASDTLPHTEQP